MVGRLTPLEGPCGQTILIPEGKKIGVGRAPENAVVINHSHVSRVHCFLSQGSEGVALEDNGSSNGTAVNGKLVRKSVLNDGDEVRIGPARFRYSQEEASQWMSPTTSESPESAEPPDSSDACTKCRAHIREKDLQANRCRVIGKRVYCPRCAAKIGLAGLTFGGYEVLDMLGRGAIGAVYKARQTSLERLVALKVLHPSLAAQETAVKRFLREAQTGAKLSHPNIVSLFDQGSIDGRHFIAMEFVDGRNLHQIVSKEGPFAQPRAAAVFKTVCEALHYAHHADIVHRDIKPANIMLTVDGDPKVADMGLAKSLVDSGTVVTQEGMVVGTPGYIPPEVVMDAPKLDHRVDIFALGATLYYTVTGQAPFDGKTPMETLRKTTVEKPAHPGQLNPSISDDFGDFVLHAMAKSPDKRQQSALDLATELREFL